MAKRRDDADPFRETGMEIFYELCRSMLVFNCGRHLIAFDGAALLLNELWQRSLLNDK